MFISQSYTHMKYLLSENPFGSQWNYIIRGYNGTFLIFVILNLCMYFAIIGSSIRTINMWNSSPITFNLLDTDCNIPTKLSQNQLPERVNSFCKLHRDITFWMRLYITVCFVYIIKQGFVLAPKWLFSCSFHIKLPLLTLVWVFSNVLVASSTGASCYFCI